MTTLYLVVPCYNEQEVLPETAKRLSQKLTELREKDLVSAQSRILFVDDGSRDATWAMISSLCREEEGFLGVKLSRNMGHQNALVAGLTVASGRCDAAVSLDADLQDDVDAIDAMLAKYHEGCDVVYGVRSSRASDTAFKRSSAQGFYKVMRALGVEVVDNHADYRLMSRRALEALLQFGEANLFLRGIVPLVGFSSATVTYERAPRFAGESKYPLKKMLAFAFDGITSFSIKPLRFIGILGTAAAVGGMAGLLAELIFWLLGRAVQAFAVLGASLWLLGGVQLLCLWILGEYIGRIYKETKRRPRFIIDRIEPG
jgi:glycosyltransferase involved in cell wall biosynthesis